MIPIVYRPSQLFLSVVQFHFEPEWVRLWKAQRIVLIQYLRLNVLPLNLFEDWRSSARQWTHCDHLIEVLQLVEVQAVPLDGMVATIQFGRAKANGSMELRASAYLVGLLQTHQIVTGDHGDVVASLLQSHLWIAQITTNDY